MDIASVIVAVVIVYSVWRINRSTRRDNERDRKVKEAETEAANREARYWGYRDWQHREEVAHKEWMKRNGITDDPFDPTRKTDHQR